MPGAKARSEEEVQAEAIRLAVRIGQRSNLNLSVISINPRDLRRDHRYSIDITKKVLIEESIPS
jgi:hypothetical protein